MSRFCLPRDIYHGKGCLEELKNLKGKNLKVNFSLPFFMRENIMIYVLNCGNCFGRETICRSNDISNK